MELVPAQQIIELDGELDCDGIKRVAGSDGVGGGFAQDGLGRCAYAQQFGCGRWCRWCGGNAVEQKTLANLQVIAFHRVENLDVANHDAIAFGNREQCFAALYEMCRRHCRALIRQDGRVRWWDSFIGLSGVAADHRQGSCKRRFHPWRIDWQRRLCGLQCG